MEKFKEKALTAVIFIIAMVLTKYFFNQLILPVISVILSYYIIKKVLYRYSKNFEMSIIVQLGQFFWFALAFVILCFTDSVYYSLVFDIISLIAGLLLLMILNKKLFGVIILLAYQIIGLVSNIGSIIDIPYVENYLTLIPIITHIIFRISAITFLIYSYANYFIENRTKKTETIAENFDSSMCESDVDNSVENRLNLINKLYKDGLISEEEYNYKRSSILKIL